MRRNGFFIVMFILTFTCKFSFAEVSNEELLREIETLRQKLEQQDQKIVELEAKIIKDTSIPKTVNFSNMTIEDFDRHLDAHLLHREEGYLMLGGLRMGIGSTFIIQGTDNANGDTLSERGEDVVDASYSMDVEFEKEFEDYGKAFLHVETGDGPGVEDELQVFSNVNRDADDSDNSMAVTEAWYEHCFKAAPAKLMAGKIDGTILIDTNEYANDETTQFLGRMFRNSPTIEFPDNAAGLRLEIEPSDLVNIKFLMMDGDNDWEDVAEDGFYGTQLNIRPGIFGRNGNYRIIGWLSDREHTKWQDSTSAKEKAYGFGLSLDQELTDVLGIFMRYGWQDPDVYLNGEAFSLEQAWSAGIQLKGRLWNREDDMLGLALGQVTPSGEYKKAGSNLSAKDEGHFEAYYNYKVNEHLTLTPDLQVIWNPYGDDAVNGKSNIAIIGMRGQVDF
ncbi:MAG: carbohydrate porin [Candidatus Omnitrophica bacterium]|nr:carbohydrate porin [Candidatus Omnitrophota bacterium]MBU4148764.1 carbohydrate porin [Candidatus Omnitrophota bacterium]